MMNTYTLDPSKPESASAPPLASAPPSVPSPPAVPYYMPSYHQYYPYQYPQVPPVAQPAISKIRDWLPWSIVNLFIGGLVLGLLPLIFSLICRSNKRKNDTNGARTMSTLALVFNIIVTVVGIAASIGALIYVLVYTQRFRMDYLPTV